VPHPTPTGTPHALQAVLASTTARSASTHPVSTSGASKPAPAPHQPVQHRTRAHHQKPAHHATPAEHRKHGIPAKHGRGGHGRR
jgi:hypothetical protein